MTISLQLGCTPSFFFSCYTTDFKQKSCFTVILICWLATGCCVYKLKSLKVNLILLVLMPFTLLSFLSVSDRASLLSSSLSVHQYTAAASQRSRLTPNSSSSHPRWLTSSKSTADPVHNSWPAVLHPQRPPPRSRSSCSLSFPVHIVYYTLKPHPTSLGWSILTHLAGATLSGTYIKHPGLWFTSCWLCLAWPCSISRWSMSWSSS